MAAGSGLFLALPESLRSEVVATSGSPETVRISLGDAPGGAVRLSALAEGETRVTVTAPKACGGEAEVTVAVKAIDYPSCEPVPSGYVDYVPLDMGNRWVYTDGVVWEVASVQSCRSGKRRALLNVSKDGEVKSQFYVESSGLTFTVQGSLLQGMPPHYRNRSADYTSQRFRAGEPEVVRVQDYGFGSYFDLARDTGVSTFYYQGRTEGMNYPSYTLTLVSGP